MPVSTRTRNALMGGGVLVVLGGLVLMMTSLNRGPSFSGERAIAAGLPSVSAPVPKAWSEIDRAVLLPAAESDVRAVLVEDETLHADRRHCIMVNLVQTGQIIIDREWMDRAGLCRHLDARPSEIDLVLRLDIRSRWSDGLAVVRECRRRPGARVFITFAPEPGLPAERLLSLPAPVATAGASRPLTHRLAPEGTLLDATVAAGRPVRLDVADGCFTGRVLTHVLRLRLAGALVTFD